MATKDIASPFSADHIICIPLPYQSHIKQMLKLAQLLHRRGFHITFVNTEFNQTRLLSSSTTFSGPDFRFETIPDGLPPSGPSDLLDPFLPLYSTRHNFLGPFCDLVARLNDTSLSSNVGRPPVSCIISDVCLPFAVKAGEKLGGIPVVTFAPVSACGLMVYRKYRALIRKGLVPPKDERLIDDEFLDKVIDWFPGMNAIRLRHLPPVDKAIPLEWLLDYLGEIYSATSKSAAIILHTFDALEQQVLNAFQQVLNALTPMGRVYSIGPLQLLLNQQIQEDEDENSVISSTTGYSLWKEENECLQWLDSKRPNSVVYVSFGSWVCVTTQELIEFGMGLAKTNYPFLWVIRPDMVIGEASVLPPEIIEEIKERSFIANWCPQEKVLNHSSIGCFVTLSGWGSTIESISAGVPMLCWPNSTDQPTNCKYVCNEWGIGMEIDEHVKRDDVERLVKEMMGTEKGMKMKERAMEWKKLAEEAAGPNGSSSKNLDKLVEQLLCRKAYAKL